MVDQQIIKYNLNQYFYTLNKYNLFGGLFAYFFALYLSFVVDKGSKDTRLLQGVLLTSVVFVLTKEILQRTFNIKDNCECGSLFGKEYIHPKYKTCPKEKKLYNMFYDIKYLLSTNVIDFIYKYNLLGGILTLLIGTVTGLIVRTSAFNDVINILILLLVVVATKLFFNFLLKTQNHCPCDCANYAGDCPPTVANSSNTNASNGADSGDPEADMRDAITKELDNEISGVSNYEPNIEEVLEKEVDKVIKKMYVEEGFRNSYKNNKKNPKFKFTDAPGINQITKSIEKQTDITFDTDITDLNDLSKKETKGLRKYCDAKVNQQRENNVDKCINTIKDDNKLKKFFKKMLQKKKNYKCLVDSSSNMQLEACLVDFLKTHPKLSMELSGLM